MFLRRSFSFVSSDGLRPFAEIAIFSLAAAECRRPWCAAEIFALVSADAVRPVPEALNFALVYALIFFDAKAIFARAASVC